jgi:SAM-dependent methyltransferase
MHNKLDKTIYENLNLLPEDSRGWNGDSFIFEQLVTEIKPKLIIEVGSWLGQSTISMGNAVKKLELDTKIRCVDTWLGALEFWGDDNKDSKRDLHLKNGYPQVYYQFLSNMVHHGLTDIVLPFPTTSTIGAKYFHINGIIADLIYIDASHEYEDVYQDLKAYYEVLRNGGILFGDDFPWPRLGDAVEKFCNDKNLTYELIDGKQFWVIRKPH